MTKTFPEVISGIRTAKKGVEVREDIAQMGEYVQQFAQTATQKAAEAANSAGAAAENQQKAAQAVQNIDQQKADSVAAVRQAQSTATTTITQTKDAALTDIGNARAGALRDVANSTAAATAAAEAAAGSASDANASKEASAASASAASTSETNSAASASAAKKSEEEAARQAELAGTRAGTDKTLSIEDAPADAKETGDQLALRYTKEETDDKLAAQKQEAAETYLPKAGGTMAAPLILPGGLTALGYADNAGNRNAMPPRDRSLGTPTSEHFEMIASGKYNELFLGDYWTVDGVDYLIADFNYWYDCGDTACTKNHVLVVPRNNMYTASMNSTNVTTGGYIGSAMHKTGLAQAKSAFNAAFGSAHILNHREFLVNAVTNGKPTGSDWYDSTVELMNENMVYGGRQFSPMPDGTDPWNTCQNYTIDKSQLSLFRYEPWLICNRQWYWLRDVVSAAGFASVNGSGLAHCNVASNARGVRPVAGIC